MSDLDKIVFKNKSLSKLLEEVYTNHSKKSNQINTLIGELKPLVEDIGDATLIVPLLKEYLDAGIKNDDILLKMVALAQKTIQTYSVNNRDNDFLGITDAEKEKLIETAYKLKEDDDLPKQLGDGKK